jgi:hypothetical protein
MPFTAEDALAQVNSLYTQLASRRPELDRLQSYFEGEQPLVYATEAWQREHSSRYKGFSDNWCGVVGTAAAERTEVSGIRIGDDDEPMDDSEKALWRDWLVNEMPLQSSQGFLTSSIARRSYVSVWGDDNDEPVVEWEHPSQVIISYAPGSQFRGRYALKSYSDGDYEYAVLDDGGSYLWKFRRAATMGALVTGQTTSGIIVVGNAAANQGWEAYQPPEDDVWPLPNPLGELTFREFPHKPMLGREPLSRISGTIAMQNFINLMWAYLAVSADFASMPARVVLGQEPPKLPILDDAGQKIGEKAVDVAELARGRMLWLTGQQTKIASWEPAKLDVFTNVINVAVKHTAAQTKTPIHYIVGELGNVNGETLKATESPLSDDVRNDHLAYGPAVRGLFRLMALVRNQKGVADACRTATVSWRNPETRSDAQLADAALKDKQIGFPLEWIAQERYGYSQTDVARLMQMIGNDPAGAGMLSGVIGEGLPGAQPDGMTGADPLSGL